MAKERSINPATAALKASKKKDIKKQKANVATQRAERIGRKNPHRIQQQIDELKEAQQAGKIRPRDKQQLEQLEKDHKAILKAREQLGDAAPVFRAPRPRDDANSVVLGKRRRGGEERRDDESDTDEDVMGIPMPLDLENMPAPPRRKPRQTQDNGNVDLSLPEKPEVKPQIVYEAAPVIKDLRKEAVKMFVPSTVARNLKKAKDAEPLEQVEDAEPLEPVEPAVESEEARRERIGVNDAERATEEAIKEAEFGMMAELEQMDGYGRDARREDEVAERQLRRVEVEEVDDDGY